MPADPRRHVLRLVLSGALACLIAQGLGRFLLTPLLPAMQAAGGLDDGAAGLLAAANFAGYLAGALLVLLAPLSQGAAVQGGLALVIAGSLAMAGPVPLWMPGRALAGLGGALLFLAGSAKAAAGLERAGRGPLAGIVFAGVGVGIALGGLLALAVLPAWRWGWLLGGLAAAGCWPLLAERGPARAASGAAAGRLAWDRPLLALSVAYACAGLAFAAGSTFFVRAVAAGDPTRAILAWTVAGAAATPSTLAWVRLGRRAGTRPALAVATVLLALGTGLAGLGQSPLLALLAGLLLGGTFIGVTALAMTLARELAPEAPARAGGLVTTAFGLGQVAGPVLTGRLLAAFGPAPALMVPAAVALLGLLALAAGSPSPARGSTPAAGGSTPAPRIPS